MKPYYQDDSQACLELIMRLHPRLCLNGYDGPGLEEKRREMLEQHVESFYRSCVLLDSVAKAATFNQRHTSYGLKHVLERAIGMYVANGTAIAALIATGFGIIPVGDINVRFNMGESGYKALDKLRLKGIRSQ